MYKQDMALINYKGWYSIKPKYPNLMNEECKIELLLLDSNF